MHAFEIIAYKREICWDDLIICVGGILTMRDELLLHNSVIVLINGPLLYQLTTCVIIIEISLTSCKNRVLSLRFNVVVCCCSSWLFCFCLVVALGCGGLFVTVVIVSDDLIGFFVSALLYMVRNGTFSNYIISFFLHKKKIS